MRGGSFPTSSRLRCRKKLPQDAGVGSSLACAGIHPGQHGPVVQGEDKVIDSSYLELVDHSLWGEFSRTQGQSPSHAPSPLPATLQRGSESSSGEFSFPCSLFLQRDTLLLWFAGLAALPAPCRQHKYPLLRLPHRLPGFGCWRAH